MKTTLHDKQSAYLAEFSTFARSYGLPSSAAKILAFLLICNPAQQTASSVQSHLHLSAGSTNTGLLLLVRVGMVERTKTAGSKLYYYEIHPESFKRAILGCLQSASISRELAEKGLEMDANNTRLTAMRDVFGLIEQELPRIIKKLPEYKR